MWGPHTLTDTKLLNEKLTAWLFEQRNIRAVSIMDGSASDYAEYRARCGYLAALTDMYEAINGIIKDVNKELTGEK